MPWHEKLLLAGLAVAGVIFAGWWVLHLIASGDQ